MKTTTSKRKSGPSKPAASSLLSSLPAVGKLLQLPAIKDLSRNHPETYVHNRVRAVLDSIRAEVLDGSITNVRKFPGQKAIVERVRGAVEAGMGNHLKRVINAAGVILHTGLGRAPLAPSARLALEEAATRYCLLATDPHTGKRGDRNRHVDELLVEITGAEAALVVNNNAAAVMLVLNTFGQGKEAVISRGELVEIGGMFRIPDVMRRAGVLMCEVGTTNKTHLNDYREAITDETTILLKVHTSNYRIEGFHKEVSIRELTELVAELNPSELPEQFWRELLILHDLGSGALVDLRRWGLEYEPTAQEAIRDGADIVTFSGDKLLGGPQCGIIIGKKALVERLKRNPLMRAIRPDKLTLSALDGTLRLFLQPDRLPQTHPLYAMMTASVKEVGGRAKRIATGIKKLARSGLTVSVIDGSSEMGSGALPARGIPSRLVSLKHSKASADDLAAGLRMASSPVFTRIENGQVLLDARTIADDEVDLLVRAVDQTLKKL